jgi:hypothetical protein
MFNSVVKKFHRTATTASSEKPNSVSTAETATPNDHIEKHGLAGEFMRDAVLGFADGLTVPFALTAGLSAYATFISDRAYIS